MLGTNESAAMMDLKQLRINGERLMADFTALAQIGATPDGGVSRPALSLEDLEARAWFADHIEEAGFLFTDDDAGNLSGIWPCGDGTARTLLIGSHLDTVPNGGRYDGSIGVLAGLEVMRSLREAEVRLPFNLEVMNFTDEEGSWISLLGSRSLAGTLPPTLLADVQGAQRAALARAGINTSRIPLAKRDPKTLIGYLELHIEQGAALERLEVPIGIVMGIVGRTTHQITFHGERGHSGTTDFYYRKDALQGAALFVTRAHMMAQSRFDGTIVNCGKLEVLPGTFNVIPEQARMLVECRHVDEATLLEVEVSLLELALDCAEIYGLRCETKRVEHMDAAEMHPDIRGLLERVCARMGLRHTSLVSYAGHDAQPLSHCTPSGMIFVPSVGGVSHNANEFSRWSDVVSGVNLLLQSVVELANHPLATDKD